MIGYFVSGAAAVVKDDQGKIRYLYEGAVMPSDVPAAELDRLQALGLVSPFDLPDAIVVGQDGVEHTGVLPVSTATSPADPATGSTDTGGDGEVKRPANVANKATWLDYRVALGHLTEEQRAAVDGEQLELTVANLKDDAFMDDWATSPASTPAES